MHTKGGTVKIILIFIGVLIGTLAGLYTRPSFFMVGQLNWLNVLTKGHFMGPIEGFFGQGMIDESFFHVLKFQGAGLVLAIIILVVMGMLRKSSSPKKAKK